MVEPFGQLESNLRAMLAEHDALLAMLKRKREAIRMAKPAVVEECVERENGHLQRIAELEKRRQQVVASLTERLEPEAAEPMTMSRIVEAMASPTGPGVAPRGADDDAGRGERLLGLSALLRERMVEVQRESRVIKQASQGLLKHVQGVMQRVTGAVTGVGTYGRSGRLAAAPVASSSFAATA